ncbi:MAG: hypothetical protein ACKVQS_01280 [Fimbriimonadaceae bacterium]
MKLSPISIFLLGLMVAVIALSYGLFQSFIPNNRDAAVYKAWGEKLDAEGAKMNQAVKRVEDAKALVKETSDKWQLTVASKTPPSSVSAGGVNIAVNPYDLTVDSVIFRNSVQKAVNYQLKKGGVVVVQGPTVPAPTDDPETILSSYYNYPGTSYPVAIFDLGQVTVRGNFSQISENIRSWSRMPNYLGVADGLIITGTAPNLTATYNVTLVAFVRGKKIGAPVEMARQKAAAASGPAGAVPGVPGAPGSVPAGAGIPGGRPTGGNPADGGR